MRFIKYLVPFYKNSVNCPRRQSYIYLRALETKLVCNWNSLKPHKTFWGNMTRRSVNMSRSLLKLFTLMPVKARMCRNKWHRKTEFMNRFKFRFRLPYRAYTCVNVSEYSHMFMYKKYRSSISAKPRNKFRSQCFINISAQVILKWRLAKTLTSFASSVWQTVLKI